MTINKKMNRCAKDSLLKSFRVSMATAVISSLILLAGCGDDSKSSSTLSDNPEEDADIVAITDKTISGVSQKGPFVNGSSVTVQELDGETLAQTGDSYEGKIKNDMGEFSVKVTKLASQYALLKANGFYRNEVTGEKSKSQITLYALTDLSKRDEVNVNLLTHLAYERTEFLATVDTLSVAIAKKQAESEVFKSFGIDGDFATAEDLNIFGKSDQSAALLAVSILMQGTLSEGDFSERLAKYAADIEKDGEWNDSKTATKIADWANAQGLGSGLTKIRENITKWELSTDVPEFEKYVNNFWWQNYGLGFCDKKRESEVLKNQNSTSAKANEYYICKSKSWQVASDIEKDTYNWLDPTVKHTEKDGDVRYGDVIKTNCYVFEDKAWRSGNANDCSLTLRGCTKLRQDTVGKGADKIWYICDEKTWRNATTYEKDTFGWKDSTDGAIKKGNVTDSIYVFDKTAWRATSAVEGILGGCVPAIADSVGKVGSTYYICKSNAWVDASALEYDTYKWDAGKDGDSKIGSVNANNCYVYENSAWRSGNASDCSLSLRGCTALRQDTVGLGSDKAWHICDGKSWRNATNIEKDTATWGSGMFSGEVRAGQINKNVYYIYELTNKTWRNATMLEMDTYDYEKNNRWPNGVEGEFKKGAITSTTYMFDSEVWREASKIELALGGCFSTIKDSVGKVDTSYYICNSKEWIYATEVQYDTYKQECSEFGQIIHGNVNPKYAYFCYGNEWKRFYGNESITYGKLVDARDGHVYRTVKVGGYIWMAENLNYADEKESPNLVDNNWCYEGDSVSCSMGRYYTWAAALDISSDYNYSVAPAETVKNSHRGICAKGWHIPNRDEWDALFSAHEGDWYAMQAKNFASWQHATDIYGFSVIPNGYADDGYCEEYGSCAFFWSATERSSVLAYSWAVYSWDSWLHYNYTKIHKASVRCVKDEE